MRDNIPLRHFVEHLNCSLNSPLPVHIPNVSNPRPKITYKLNTQTPQHPIPIATEKANKEKKKRTIET